MVKPERQGPEEVLERVALKWQSIVKKTDIQSVKATDASDFQHIANFAQKLISVLSHSF